MARSRLNSAAPLIVLAAAVALLLAAVAPVFATPTDTPASRVRLAVHVDPQDCDTVTTVGGVILIGGVALTVPQLAVLGADGQAALALAAAATASGTGQVCVDVVLGPGVGQITVNAHIDLCPVTVDVDAGGVVTLDGVVIGEDLLSADLTNLLEAAAAADVNACVAVTVDDNDVTVDVTVDACVMATLHDDGSVTVEFGGEVIEFPAGAIDVSSGLEVEVAVQIALRISASLELLGDNLSLEGEVIVIDGCGEGGPSVPPSASVPPSGSIAPSASVPPSGSIAPSASVPPSASPTDSTEPVITPPSTDTGSPSGRTSVELRLPALMLSMLAISALFVARRRASRIR